MQINAGGETINSGGLAVDSDGTLIKSNGADNNPLLTLYVNTVAGFTGSALTIDGKQVMFEQRQDA
jgi:hypothetical protein